MDETRIQIGDEVLLVVDISADWYISSAGYDGESVDITLRKKSDIGNCWTYTEPNSSEKPNNCKDEPQSDVRKFLGYACETCKHKDEEWDSEACDGCCENNDHYEKDEPQTERSK